MLAVRLLRGDEVRKGTCGKASLVLERLRVVSVLVLRRRSGAQAAKRENEGRL